MAPRSLYFCFLASASTRASAFWLILCCCCSVYVLRSYSTQHVIREEMEVKIWLPDQISGPLVGWKSAMRRVAMLRATMDGQMGGRPFWEWKANSKDQWRNLVPTRWREARAVGPRAPLSLRIFVHERMVEPQYYSQTGGTLSSRSSNRACSPADGKEVGRSHIFLEIVSTTESIFRMADGKRAIK